MHDPRLPRVSVIIVNYNYQDYLLRAYRSVASQSYPYVEIIIVDDKSTDRSCATIDDICAADARVVPVKLTENGGQSIASLRGFSASSGALVYFLDADDELLPECLEAHVYAHLSSRILIAFTTVDVVNNVAGDVVNFSHAGFSAYVASRQGLRPEAVRPVDKTMPGSWFGERKPSLCADQMHFVLPPHVEPWVWSPTSANCYRRDAVALLFREPELRKIRWGTDAYLIKPLSALFGSILIDRPLMQYMIHTDNKFVKTAPLHNMRFFDSTSTDDDMRVMARTAIELLMSRTVRDGLNIEPAEFFDAMRALNDGYPGPKAGEKPGDFYAQQLSSNRETLAAAFGEKALIDEMKRQDSIYGKDESWLWTNVKTFCRSVHFRRHA